MATPPIEPIAAAVWSPLYARSRVQWSVRERTGAVEVSAADSPPLVAFLIGAPFTGGTLAAMAAAVSAAIRHRARGGGTGNLSPPPSLIVVGIAFAVGAVGWIVVSLIYQRRARRLPALLAVEPPVIRWPGTDRPPVPIVEVAGLRLLEQWTRNPTTRDAEFAPLSRLQIETRGGEVIDAVTLITRRGLRGISGRLAVTLGVPLTVYPREGFARIVCDHLTQKRDTGV